MRVVIIDDQPVFSEFLSEKVRSQFQGREVEISICSSHDFKSFSESDAEFVIIDMSMPGFWEFSTPPAGENRKQPALLFLDVRNDRARLEKARALGAKGYIAKTASAELIGAAIALVAAGGIYFPDSIESRESRLARGRLSRRQLEVLEFLKGGMSNREIAEKLGISVGTVKLHVHAILAATGARNRTEAALMASRDLAA